MLASVSPSQLCGFSVFLAVFLVASRTNHIDDTDETFGYWEPLHYLTNGVGMQTWEYSPEFAIRSYAFVLPAWLVSKLIAVVAQCNGLAVFYGVRMGLAIFQAFACATFIQSIGGVDGMLASMTGALMLASPGLIYASTSLLPSAVAMGIVMLASAALLNQNYAGSIAWGCVAVLWTGWPFVGAIFAPFGLLMLAETAYSGKLMGLIRLLAGGLGILIGTATLPLVIDSMVYGKLTCPTLNILLYNAIGGSGDELYGVEPAAYYIKNLVLNTTIVWPISLMLPVVLSIFTFVRALTSRDVCTMASGAGGKSRAFWSSSWYEFLSVLTLSGAALLWQAVLFSRPHKEERFMYPIYPLIALSAAAAVRIVPIILGAAVNASTNGAANGAGAGQAGQAGQSACVFLTRLLWILPVLGLTLSASRLTSNYRNFYGYMQLWERVPSHVISTSPHKEAEVNVCTGSGWYLFPSHFHIHGRRTGHGKGTDASGTGADDHVNIRLRLVEDGFAGMLPRYFAESQPVNILDSAGGLPSRIDPLRGDPLTIYLDGLRAATGDYFNDKNEGHPEGFLPVADCDYIVALLPEPTAEGVGDHGDSNGVLVRHLLSNLADVQTVSDRQASDTSDDRGASGSGAQRTRRRYAVVDSVKVIDAERSLSMLARAFYIPFGISDKKNRFRRYALLAVEEEVLSD